MVFNLVKKCFSDVNTKSTTSKPRPLQLTVDQLVQGTSRLARRGGLRAARGEPDSYN